VYKGNLNGEDVCVKVLRIFTSNFERTKLYKVGITVPVVVARRYLIYRKSISREVLIWKKLDHQNIIPFLGVDTKLRFPSYCLISPWIENGNALLFLKRFPDAERLILVCTI
jgi:serine/threonine protein kinase